MSNRPSHKTPSSVRVRQAQAAGAGSSTRWLLIGGAAVVVVAALVIAMLATRSEETSEMIYGTVTVTGTNLPELPEAGPDPAIGQKVPEIKGQAYDGTAITIPVSGKPKVVMVVAHWCPHCQKEVPLLTEHFKSGGRPSDVDLYTISSRAQEGQSKFPPAKWLRDEDWPIPTLADNQETRGGGAYGLSGFPFFVAVAGDGTVVERTSGEKTTQEFDALVDAARKGPPATG